MQTKPGHKLALRLVKILLQFANISSVRKKRKIAEVENGLVVAEKLLVLQFGIVRKYGRIDNLFRTDPAVQFHPAIPVGYPQIPVQNDDPDIDHVKDLFKNHAYLSRNR